MCGEIKDNFSVLSTQFTGLPVSEVLPHIQPIKYETLLFGKDSLYNEKNSFISTQVAGRAL